MSRRISMDKEKDKQKNMSKDIKGCLWISQVTMDMLGNEKINIRINQWINMGDQWIYQGYILFIPGRYPWISKRYPLYILRRYPHLSQCWDISGYLRMSRDIYRSLFGANSQMKGSYALLQVHRSTFGYQQGGTTFHVAVSICSGRSTRQQQ